MKFGKIYVVVVESNNCIVEYKVLLNLLMVLYDIEGIILLGLNKIVDGNYIFCINFLR